MRENKYSARVNHSTRVNQQTGSGRVFFGVQKQKKKKSPVISI